MLVQLAYELAIFPGSCIAKDVDYWYNSLYSELFREVEFPQCHPNEYCEQPQEVEDFEELFNSLATGDVVVVIETILRNRLEELSRRLGRRIVRQLCRRLERSITRNSGRRV